MDKPIEMEVKEWTSPGPFGIGIAFHRRLQYKNTGLEVTPAAVLALHNEVGATGYFVKAKSAQLDACRLAGYILGGQVTSVKDGLVTISDPDRRGLQLTVLPRETFLELYEVD